MVVVVGCVVVVVGLSGRTGMRMRAITAAGRVTYVSSPRASPSISHQLCDILAATFANSPSTYRLVGHSLGTSSRDRPSPQLPQTSRLTGRHPPMLHRFASGSPRQ